MSLVISRACMKKWPVCYWHLFFYLLVEILLNTITFSQSDVVFKPQEQELWVKVLCLGLLSYHRILDVPSETNKADFLLSPDFGHLTNVVIEFVFEHTFQAVAIFIVSLLVVAIILYLAYFFGTQPMSAFCNVLLKFVENLIKLITNK